MLYAGIYLVSLYFFHQFFNSFVSFRFTFGQEYNPKSTFLFSLNAFTNSIANPPTSALSFGIYEDKGFT